jgi:hypothetical protein
MSCNVLRAVKFNVEVQAAKFNVEVVINILTSGFKDFNWYD